MQNIDKLCVYFCLKVLLARMINKPFTIPGNQKPDCVHLPRRFSPIILRYSVCVGQWLNGIEKWLAPQNRIGHSQHRQISQNQMRSIFQGIFWPLDHIRNRNSSITFKTHFPRERKTIFQWSGKYFYTFAHYHSQRGTMLRYAILHFCTKSYIFFFCYFSRVFILIISKERRKK